MTAEEAMRPVSLPVLPPMVATEEGGTGLRIQRSLESSFLSEVVRTRLSVPSVPQDCPLWPSQPLVIPTPVCGLLCDRKCCYKLFFHQRMLDFPCHLQHSSGKSQVAVVLGDETLLKGQGSANPKQAGFYLIISAYTSQPLPAGKERRG